MLSVRRICFYAWLLLSLHCDGQALRHGPALWKVASGTKNLGNTIAGRELISQCKMYYRNATLDHFSWVMSSSSVDIAIV